MSWAGVAAEWRRCGRLGRALAALALALLILEIWFAGRCG